MEDPIGVIRRGRIQCEDDQTPFFVALNTVVKEDHAQHNHFSPFKCTVLLVVSHITYHRIADLQLHGANPRLIQLLGEFTPLEHQLVGLLE
jgi:hypothetical protein